jgi:hypothetical protein
MITAPSLAILEAECHSQKFALQAAEAAAVNHLMEHNTRTSSQSPPTPEEIERQRLQKVTRGGIQSIELALSHISSTGKTLHEIGELQEANRASATRTHEQLLKIRENEVALGQQKELGATIVIETEAIANLTPKPVPLPLPPELPQPVSDFNLKRTEEVLDQSTAESIAFQTVMAEIAQRRADEACRIGAAKKDANDQTVQKPKAHKPKRQKKFSPILPQTTPTTEPRPKRQIHTYRIPNSYKIAGVAVATLIWFVRAYYVG